LKLVNTNELSTPLKTFRQIIQYDNLLGHKYVPNQYTRLRYGNSSYFIETDQYGFRNSSSKNSGKKTILLLGDSFAAGDGVNNHERFSNLLEQLYDCTIINIAVSGYGVDQQILAYKKYAEIIEHDAVLFTPHLDDLKRNLLKDREGVDKSTGKPSLIPKPYFVLQNDVLQLKNSPVPLERKEVIEDKDVDGHSLVSRTKKYVNRRIRKQKIHPELSKTNSEEWKLMHPLIEHLKSLAKNKPIIIAPFPYYDSVTYNEGSFFLSPFREHASDKVHILDVATQINNAYAKDKNALFLPLCGHFTSKAHAIIGNHIGNEMEMHFGVEKRKESATTQRKSDDIYVLGISCFYHDSAAALLKNGEIIAAAQEERFTRVKHDKNFPDNAINYCLEEAKLNIQEITSIVYYDYETWTIERVLHNVEAIGSAGKKLWDKAKDSLYTKLKLPQIIRSRTMFGGAIYKSQHHASHAAGAYYPSPFNEAAILVIDGVGEWACSTIAVGDENKMHVVAQQQYPHSLGLLYSAFTYFCGFKVNSGEYKLMGLAPYGRPIYVDKIKKYLVDIKKDGSILLNLEYFSFLEGSQMTNEKFAELFGGPERSRESDVTRREMDLAASIQAVTEEVVIKMANHAYVLTGKKNLVMSGGVALNCVSNGKLFDETPYEEFHFQPASGDAGGAEGCALNWYHENYPSAKKIIQPNAYLGPAFSMEETEAFLKTKGLVFHKFNKESRADTIAGLLANKNIIGHLDGRMEFGPRALGNRSIIADPTDIDMQSNLNLRIKFRESFRPFAPIYAEERTKELFDFDRPSPYMLIVRNVKPELLVSSELNLSSTNNMIDIVNQKRSELPAITHVDNSARLQSVNASQNKRFHEILMAFEKLNGKAVLINTSFNVRGEPIVCNLNDAYKCFMRTNMDVLILNDYYLIKTEQPDWTEVENWQETFELD
jgi:carbamoyltransferase